MCLGFYFFGYILFRVCSTSWTYRFMSVAKFGKFSAIIFLWVFFHLRPLSPSSQDHTEMNVGFFLLESPRSLRLCAFVFSVLFRLGNFWCLFFQFTDCFLCRPHSAVESIQLAFYFVYCIFSPFKFQFHLFFLYGVIFLKRRPGICWGSVCICFKHVLNGLLKHFCHGLL